MGTVQGKEVSSHSSSSYSEARESRMGPPPPTTVQALRAVMKSPSFSKTNEHHTLDRTLKGFLRHCNLSGLEYRLRLAGIYTLEDLVSIDEAKLTRHGFTRLMAKRLYTSLDEYLMEPDEITTPPVSLRRRPSEMVRRVQKPFTRASTLMRSRQNFGKMNLKRVPSNKRPATPQRPLSLKMPDDFKRNTTEEGSFVMSAYFPDELMITTAEVYNNVTTEDNPAQNQTTDLTPVNQATDLTPVNQATDLTPVNQATDLTPVNEGSDLTQSTDFTPVNEGANLTSLNQPSVLNLDTPVNESPELDDFVLISSPNDNNIDYYRSETTPTPEFLLQGPPLQIERCISLPNGLHRLQMATPPLQHNISLCSSSPSLFDFYTQEEDDKTTNSQSDKSLLQEAMTILQDALSRLDDIVSALYVLLDMLKEGYWVLSSTDEIGWIVRSVNNNVQDLEFAELGCRVLKYATYQLIVNNNNSLIMESDLSLVLCQCVVNGLKLHPHSQRVQLNGSLVLANLLRIDKSLGASLMEVNIFSIFTTTLKLYQQKEIVLLAMMNALASIAAGISGQDYAVSTELEYVVEQVLNVIEVHVNNLQLQNYSFSFLTLGLIDVAAQLDSKIATRLVRVIVQSMTNHIHDVDLVVWGCKTLSQIASHEILQEEAITELVSGVILSALAEHPKSSRIQMWASYALYQQVTYNKTLLPLVEDTGVIQKCQDTLPHLTMEAQSYLKNLTEFATI